jgi:hypothetical protein
MELDQAQAVVSETDVSKDKRPKKDYVDETDISTYEFGDLESHEGLLRVLSAAHIDHIIMETREHVVKYYLLAVENSLKSCGYSRASITLHSRAFQPFRSWQKDQYVSAADMKRTVLSSGKFPASHYAILIALVVHDLLSVAKNLVQKWNKERRH